MRGILVAVLLLGCQPTKPPCTAESRDALVAIYQEAGNKIIDSGACDKYVRVEDCPAYLVLEQHFVAVETALCK